jgi:hypothetical protein
VGAVDRKVRPPQDLAQVTRSLDVHVVDGMLHGTPRDVGVVEGLRRPGHDVLEQGAAQRDVQGLMSPADAQKRFAGGDPQSDQSQLGLVPLCVHLAGPRFEVVSVAIGRDVLSAAEQQTIEAIDEARPVLLLGEGWNDNRGPACVVDGPRVRRSDRVHRGIEQPGGIFFPPGNANQGSTLWCQCTSLVSTFLQTCGTATAIAKEVQLGAPDLGATHHLDPLDTGREEQERALDADAV